MDILFWFNRIWDVKETEYDLYYTGLVHIHRHYAEASAKSKTSKIIGFKEYLENFPNLRQLDGEVSSSKDKEHDEELEDETMPTMVQFVGEDEGDVLERDSDDEPLVRLTLQERKERIDYSEDQAPLAIASLDMPTVSTYDMSQVTGGVVIALPPYVPPTI